jgi:eukaryotic-like serine/threonine-protein kinase
MLSDSPELQTLLTRLFPALSILGIAKPSGQRVVYFCRLPNLNKATLTLLREENGLPADVVVKVSSGNDPTAIAYMEKEIKTLNELDSIYFPRLYHHEVVSEDPVTDTKLIERLFITIEERKDARPLTECLETFANEIDVIELMHSLLTGLSVLWNHPGRLVHRDLKPDNILISPDRAIYIIDLGILRETGAAGVTATHAPYGPMTVLYTSPEQAKNDKRNISFKSDCFSLATIAYELLAKKNPYVLNNDQSFAGVYNAVISHSPVRLDKIAKCSNSFATLLEQMMQKEPYKRHRTIEALRTDLAQIRERTNEH